MLNMRPQLLQGHMHVKEPVSSLVAQHLAELAKQHSPEGSRHCC
jgi:hypothetical protein